MKTVPTPDFVSERHTDVGNARRLVAAHGQDLRYVPQWGTWLVWNGQRWQRDHAGVVVERAKQVANNLFDEARRIPDDGERKRSVQWALQSEQAGRIRAMVDLARTAPGIAVMPDELDADAWLLNVRNGVLDLRCGQLHPHDQTRLITKLADVEYHPDADAPRWQRFLEHVLPDPELREFLARWFGYCLTGDVSEHKALFAVGVGGNGKGTAFNTVARILDEYAGQAAPDLLLRRRDDPHPAGVADLHGRRLVLASETAQNRHLDEALLKRLTGGDRIKARHMHKDFFEFAPTHKFVVATNHKPGIEGTDYGIWRRVRLMPFTVIVPDEQRDLGLEDKLVAGESEGILRWAVDGCRRWQASGLTEPLAVTMATADYRAEQDALGEFISDCCVLASGISARAADLYAAYGRWCEAMGEHALSQRKFGTALRERGHENYRNNGRWWRGIALCTEPMSDGRERETAGQDWYNGTDGTK